MSSVVIFFILEAIILIVVALLLFKSMKEFTNCFYSFLFSGWYVFWKKLWDTHFNRAMKFTGYIAIVLVASWINKVIFL
jgi:hypothetical protein